jgi:hypothetical protein
LEIDLANYDTDKSIGYLTRYRKEFADLFDKPITLLELGVQRGGSMALFRDLFPLANIVGLDLNAIEIDDKSGRVHVYQRVFNRIPGFWIELRNVICTRRIRHHHR